MIPGYMRARLPWPPAPCGARARGARRAAAVAGAMLVALGTCAWGVPAAQAAVPAAAVGRAGGCTTADKDAVTVVIDYGPLGGGVQTYCASGLKPGAVAMDALTAVGLSITGTTQYGQASVCRIDNRPGPSQQLGVTGDPTYTESCVNMPPTSSYWAQWYAPSGGSWTYSSAGALGQRLVMGGFTGWVFELNKTMATSTPPPVKPVTPAAPAAPAGPTGAAPAPSTAATHVPAQSVAASRGAASTGTAASAAPARSGTNSSPAAASGAESASATPTGAALSQTPAPTDSVAPALGASTDAPTASSGPGAGTIAGLVVVAVLIVAGVVVGLVRRRGVPSAAQGAPRP